MKTLKELAAREKLDLQQTIRIIRAIGIPEFRRKKESRVFHHLAELLIREHTTRQVLGMEFDEATKWVRLKYEVWKLEMRIRFLVTNT